MKECSIRMPKSYKLAACFHWPPVVHPRTLDDACPYIAFTGSLMMFLRKTACAAGLALLTLFATVSHAATDAAGKTLHLFLSTSETGLDPAVASDLASLNLMEDRKSVV